MGGRSRSSDRAFSIFAHSAATLASGLKIAGQTQRSTTGVYSCNGTYLVPAGGGVPKPREQALSGSNWASSVRLPARMLFLTDTAPDLAVGIG